MMIVFALISYYSIRQAALKTGKERLTSLSHQLVNMFSASALTMSATGRHDSTQSIAREYILTSSETSRNRLLNVMKTMHQDSLSWGVELVNIKGNRLVFSGYDSLDKFVNFDSLHRIALARDSFPLGRIYNKDNHLVYPVIVRVNHQKKIIGHLITWRLLRTSQAAIDQFSELMGTGASLYVGNRDRSTWTDLLHLVPDPLPADTTQSGNTIMYSRDSKNFQAIANNIPNTSWMFLIEFTEESVMATANRILKLIILIGSLLLLAGILLGWMMSRNITRPLRELTNAASSIAGGNYESRVAVHRRDELGKLARAFNAMIQQVNKARKDLENKVIEAGQINDQLRELSAHLQNIREEERIHIAREMHDELGQLLTGFKMDVSWLHKKMEVNGDPGINEKLQEMKNLINEATKFVRTLASELRPSILDDLGLIPALEWHSQEFQRRSNIEVVFYSTINDLVTTDLVATGLFRMYQEALTNISRHAEATLVNATLEEKNGRINLSITDNGKGFEMDSTGVRKTLGLLGMRERATMIGGQLEIISAPGKGTTILVTAPILAPPTVTIF